MKNQKQLLIILSIVLGLYINPNIIEIAAQSINELDKSLFDAVEKGELEKVKDLLSKGGNVNLESKDGTTLLTAASANGHEQVVNALIDKGANVNVKDKFGWTALIVAMLNRHNDIAKVLIDNGANVNEKHPKGWTALMMASQLGFTEIAKDLIAKGADVNAKSNGGKTALMLASYYNQPEIVKELLAHGADVDGYDDNGLTAKSIAKSRDNRNILDLLNNAEIIYLEVAKNGNLRTGPSTTYEVTGKVNVGMKVKQFNKEGDWYMVELADKKTGWINEILISDNTTTTEIDEERVDQFVKKCILLISLDQVYKNEGNIFRTTDNRKEFAKIKLSRLRKEYQIGKFKEGSVMPGDSYVVWHDMWIFTSKETWFDPISLVYSTRGSFPKIDFRKSKYKVFLLNDGNIVDKNDNKLINGIKVEIEDDTEVRLDGNEWIYKNRRWMKKQNKK